MSSNALAIKAEDLYALEALTEVQQEMLETLLSRFTGEGPSGPTGMDVDEGDSSPMALPVVKIRQRMTTDVACPESSKIGDLYATSGDLLEKPTAIIPVAIWTSHIKWEPGGGSNIECSSPDGKLGVINLKCAECPDRPWRDGEKQDCDRVLNAIVLTDNLSLFQIRFASSSYTAGRTLVRFARTQPSLWNRQYALDSSSRKNAKGEFHVFEVKALGQEPSEDVKKVAQYVCLELANNRKGFLEAYYARIQGTAEPEKGVVEVGVSKGEDAKTAPVGDGEPDFGDM
jgi:hypothetical protein